MEQNSLLADLEFVGSIIKELNVKNDATRIPNPSNASINIGSSVSPAAIIEENGTKRKEGVIALRIKLTISDEEGDAVSDVSLTIEGCYHADAAMSEESFDELLKINGLANLYSIARAEVLTLTAHMYTDGKIALPMINVHEYYKNISSQATEAKE